MLASIGPHPPARTQTYRRVGSLLLALVLCFTLTAADTPDDNATPAAMATGMRTVRRLFTAIKQREGGGFVVRRSVGSPHLNVLDPFLMLDHLGPTEYGPGEAVGAPDHPHRGFETVTYVLDGGFHHQDNAGNEVVRDFVVSVEGNAMAVIHSEMPTEELLEKGGRMEGFQLWVNLPAKDKMVAPRYQGPAELAIGSMVRHEGQTTLQDTAPEKIPKVPLSDGKGQVVVIAGEALGTKAVIETRSPMLFLDVQLEDGGNYTDIVPSGYDGFVYIYRGAGRFGPDKTPAGESQFFQLGEGNQFTASADGKQGVRFLLIAGVPLREPVARYGPFVMNTQAEIRQAILDFNSGRFGREIAGAAERSRKTEQARDTQRSSGRWSRESDEL